MILELFPSESADGARTGRVGLLVPNCQFTNATVLAAGVSLNEFEAPPHSSPNVAVDASGPITITFSPPIFAFSGYFTYLSPLSIAAFGANGTQVASAASTF